jgi:hypothetical protein
MQIVQTSITFKRFGKSSQYLVQISSYGDDNFPYMYAVAHNKNDAEQWLLRHCQKFGKGVIFAMPNKTLASFA